MLSMAVSASAQVSAPVASTQLPTGGKVMSGTTSIQSVGNVLNINQSSQRSAINWNTFNVGSGAKVNFIQPSASSVALNRVLDTNGSQILGSINANGQVFRTDLRLRPDGDSGPLAWSLDAFEQYLLTQGREWERYAWIKARAITVKSDLVSDAIIAAARKQKCDLIVMASHGRRGVKRLLLGSETQQVLTHSQVPVLVLR